MTGNPHRSHNHHAQLLWAAIIVIAVVTFLVDVAGWFRDGGLLP